LPSGILRLSADRRHLVDDAGRPFFYFADTAWSVVWKGSPEQWATYLDRRRQQGFSVLQVNLLPWRWHLTDVEGNRPFRDDGPTRPNEAYFARFDRFLAMAAERDLHTCLMLLWGGPRPNLPASRFTTEQAVRFASYAVERFGRFPVLWSLSGDAEYSQELEKWEAVGAAVEAADRRGHPTTNHLPPSMNWRFLHHDAPWHDFHMLQTGHRRSALADIAALPAAYYRADGPKAVVNGEPWYEAHPSRDVREVYGPAFTAYDARYALWTSVLSGATMGHTYGAQGIWNWKRPGDDESELAGPQIGPTWTESLDLLGAEQCALASRFLRGVDWSRLVPCPERVELQPGPLGYEPRPSCAEVPGVLRLVYLPAGPGRPLLKGLAAVPWRAGWLDPRSGVFDPIGQIDPALDLSWRAPERPSGEDWVLVLAAG
jgi:hypothetical protein